MMTMPWQLPQMAVRRCRAVWGEAREGLCLLEERADVSTSPPAPSRIRHSQSAAIPYETSSSGALAAHKAQTTHKQIESIRRAVP